MVKLTIQAKDVVTHFDSLASRYDRLKDKNWFYYKKLKEIVRRFIPANQIVLDIGTGTGDILDCVKPSKGTGIDISPKMTELAKNKYPQYTFCVSDYKTFQRQDAYDFIIVADVIEHLDEPASFFSHIERLISSHTKIILTMANPLWDPLLLFLEKIGLKMKEGPHYRISEKALLCAAEEKNFNLIHKDNYVLIPLYIPLLTWTANHAVIHLPYVKRLALTQCFVFQKKLPAHA